MLLEFNKFAKDFHHQSFLLYSTYNYVYIYTHMKAELIYMPLLKYTLGSTGAWME